MANPEKKEISAETSVESKPKPELKKQEPSYFSRVSRYFSELDKTAFGEEEMVDYYRTLRSPMEKLATKGLDKQVKPQDAAMALAEIAGHMALTTPYIESNELTEGNKKHYKDLKDIFLESCVKLYPDTKIVLKEGDVKEALKSLGLEFDIYRPRSGAEAVSPEYLEGLLYFAGQSLQQEAFRDFRKEDFQEQSVANDKLASNVKAYYKLVLMRDQSYKKFYGSEDKSPVAIKQIDQIREQLNPEQKNKTEAVENLKEKTELTGEEKSTLLKLEEALRQEVATSEKSEEDGSVYLRELEPAITAFRSVYRDDKMLSRRLVFLAKQVKYRAAQKLSTGKTKDPILARFHSQKEIFSELTPIEHKAFEQAVKNETYRSEQASKKKKGGLTIRSETPAVSLFSNLMEIIGK